MLQSLRDKFSDEKDMDLPMVTPLVTQTSEIPTDQRHDFYYIVAGGFTLSACAGFVNSVSMLSTFKMTISHNTGVTTRLGQAIAKVDIANIFYLSMIILSYVLGATFIGAIIRKERFYYSRKYGILLILEAIVITIAAYLYSIENVFGVYVVSFGMGLQNSLFTNFSGAVVRTTHVSGLLTDIGLLFGHWIRFREKPKEFWRIKVFIPLFSGFVSGACLASWCFDLFGVQAMYIPCGFLTSVGIIWTVWRLRWQRSQEYYKHDI